MNVTFRQAADAVDACDFVEVTIETHTPIEDPFRAVEVAGTFGRAGEAPVTVDGFCDSQDGSVYRVRFLPTEAGDYECRVTFRYGAAVATQEGRFTARDAGRKGLLRVDPEHPYHFLWSGTGEHFFWNGTTTYALAGCREEVIAASIARLERLGINRIRVALSPAHVESGMAWHEPVTVSEDFTFLYGPWLAARPDSVEDPGWDVTRFDVAYWRRFEGLVAYARARDMVVSVIFYLDGARPGCYPFPRDQFGGNTDEERYYRYAAARLAAFSNVVWDVTNEWRLFRNEAWVEAMGAFLSECDPYGHLMSVHGHEDFPYRTSPWADYALFQSWDAHGGYAFMLKNRQEQEATGRPIPQINEEYGYEDHYPYWGNDQTGPPLRNADSRRRLAWEMTMAGAYQTTGERAVSAAGEAVGGWINGRGDDSMTMLDGYAHLKAFFTRFDWWKMEPRPDVAQGAMCLAEPGVRYVVYVPDGGASLPELNIEGDRGDYTARWYDPRTGTFGAGPDGSGDWVLLLERVEP